MDTMDDVLERMKAGVDGQDLVFPRPGFYIAASILGCVGWAAFWNVVEGQQHVAHTQTVAWACVLVAVWVAYTF